MRKNLTKYLVEITTDDQTGFGPKVGWDTLYDRPADAKESLDRAIRLFSGARLATIEAPAHVDHLYRNIADAADTSYLYR